MKLKASIVLNYSQMQMKATDVEKRLRALLKLLPTINVDSAEFKRLTKSKKR